jgi:hypothetical protein
MRIKKRIGKIEDELTSLGIDISKLGQDDDDTGLLNELNSDENVDELSGSSDEDTSYKKQVAGTVQRLPTMEEKKQQINNRCSAVQQNYADVDPEEMMEDRIKDYINAIEYLKKNNLSNDQTAIFELLQRAETVKKLQRRDDVEIYDIPGEVTPDDILGISQKDRLKKFQAITTHVNKTMNDLKLIGSNNFKIYNATKNGTSKENYDKSIALFQKQAQLKKDLVELAKNRWQPLPEVQSITEIFTDPINAGEIDASVGEVKIKLTVPESFQNNNKYYYKFKWMDEDDILKKMKVKNNEAELERGFKIDFGHHKKFSSLTCTVKIKVWR